MSEGEGGFIARMGRAFFGKNAPPSRENLERSFNPITVIAEVRKPPAHSVMVVKKRDGE